jgi:hypothetical protein
MVLPTPASPVMTSAAGAPEAAEKNAQISAISASRPTGRKSTFHPHPDVTHPGPGENQLTVKNATPARRNVTDSGDSRVPRAALTFRVEGRRTGVPTYLVERYWPGVTSGRLLEALQRVRQVMDEMSGEGTRVCDISCTLIPAEEVVFSVYKGPSADAVRQLNQRARIPVSRIVEAIAVNLRPQHPMRR